MAVALRGGGAEDGRVLLPDAACGQRRLLRVVPTGAIEDGDGEARRSGRCGDGQRRSAPKWPVEWPEQFVPMALPPYSPELNPVEQVFRQLRGWLSNRVFDSLDQMGDVLIEEIREFWENPQVLVRLTYYPWWRQAIENIPS